MTGYQEILTDPSYAGQIIAFTFPHIGNVGTNPEDIETLIPAARGLVVRAPVTEPSSWRAADHLERWLTGHGLPGIAGIDTRALTVRIRDSGAPSGALQCAPKGKLDIEALRAEAAAWPGLEGMDLAGEVTCRQTYDWAETRWTWGRGYGALATPGFRVVAVDYGAKRNILRCLASLGCAVTVVPAAATAGDILRHAPDGIFLSNGPGDPAATGAYAVPVIRDLLASGTNCWHSPWGPRRGKWPSGTAAPTTRSRTSPPAGSRSPARTTASWSWTTRSRRAWRRPTCRCSTVRWRASPSATGPCSRCSTTPRPPPAPRTATTCSSASSR
jgi:carbamoylphosphate synthase small subunit